MTDEIEKLISDPNKLNEIANEILKFVNSGNLLSQAMIDLELENKELSDNDEDYLKNLPKKKSSLTNEILKKMTQKDQKEFLIKSEKKNLRTIQKVKEKLKTAMKKDKHKNRYATMTRKMLSYVKENFDFNEVRYGKYEDDLEYDQDLLRQLKTLFNQIRSQKIKAYAQKGKRPIINRFIQAKYGNSKDIFVTKKATNNLTFNFVVDQSGSMGGNTRRVGKLVKTFFKAIEDITEIKINVIGYESMRINTVFNNPNDLYKISYSGGSTPTAQAITYTQDLIKNQSGKSVLILLSDGYPNGIGSYLNIEKYIKYILDDLKKLKRVESFGIMIGGGNWSAFSKMFGKNFAEFSSIESANDELIKIFKMFIDEYLRSY